MKFSLTATSFFFTAAAVLNDNNVVVEAVSSPYVTCCEEQGGTYEILNTSDGQSGFCKFDNENYEEVTFYDNYCAPTPSPTPGPTPGPTPSPTQAPTQGYTYDVYAVNDSCGMPSGSSVSVEFVLQTVDGSFVERIVQVDIDNDQCVYVGGTNEDTVDYTVTDSFVSSGHVSCKDIGNSNNDDCNLLGIDDNACVINIC